MLKGVPSALEGQSDEGFVIDFSDIKAAVQEAVVGRLDHAFLAMGNEPVLETLKATGSKVALLSFRTTAENLSAYIAYEPETGGVAGVFGQAMGDSDLLGGGAGSRYPRGGTGLPAVWRLR